MRIGVTGVDLGITLTIRVPQARNLPRCRDGLAAFGEIGLTGRLRAATQADRYALEDARKLSRAIVLAPIGTKGVGVEAETLRAALAAGLGEKPS